jgi:hypothetical protein
VEWIPVFQDINTWLAIVNKEMKLHVTKKAGIYLATSER